ncbi:MAG: hypothetical protein KIT27_06000 [Legionellales bacterium]|nr:hypothetical protein [Legionellales bacterium]
MKKFILSLFLVSNLVMLSGCDFQLREKSQLAAPLQRIYLTSRSPIGDVTKELRQTLLGSGIQLVDLPQQSRVTLTVLSEYYVKSQPSIAFNSPSQTSSITGTYYATFRVTDYRDKEIIPVRQVSASQTFTANANQVLGSNEQERTIKAELVRDICNQIINQLMAKNTIAQLEKSNATTTPSS